MIKPNLNPGIEIMAIAQAFARPCKRTNVFIANELTTRLVHLPCAPVYYGPFRHAILGFRLTRETPSGRHVDMIVSTLNSGYFVCLNSDDLRLKRA